MDRWETVPETYTPEHCLYRMDGLVAIERWNQNGRKKFKPKWAWSCGADKLFHEGDQYLRFG